MSLKYYRCQQFLCKEENSAVLELRDTDNERAVERFGKTSNLVVRINDKKYVVFACPPPNYVNFKSFTPIKLSSKYLYT